MSQVWSNNANSVLAAGISNSATTITINGSHGSRFPVVASPNFAWATLEDASGNIEIVKITTHTSGSSSFTVVRAQQGTTARAFSTGDVFEVRLTAAELAGFELDIDNLEATRARHDGQVYTGVHQFPSTVSIGNVSATEISFLDGVTSAIQTQLNSKGAIAGQTWTGTHVFPANTSIGLVSATEIGYLDGVTSPIQTQLNALDVGKSDVAGDTYSGVHDFTSATLRAATRPLGTNDNTVATMAALQQAVFDSANLPASPSDGIEYYLSVLAGIVSWKAPSENHLHNHFHGIV